MTQVWHRRRLADVAERITDGSHNPPKGIADSEFLMLSSKNVFDDNLHYEDPRYLSSDQFYREDRRTAIRPGDVLLTIVGTIGRCAVVPVDAPKITAQRSVAVIRADNKVIEPRFLMYTLINRRAELNDQARGVAQKGIYLETLRELEVESPSLAEQQRIVAVLDEAFGGIAIARVNTEVSLRHARELFESHLNGALTQPGEGWTERRLGDVCSIARGGSPRPIQKFLTNGADGINWIKIGDATASGKYIYKTEEKIIPDGARRSRIVRDGDFLLSNSMSFGRPYIMRTTGCIHDGWLVLSDYGSSLDQDYLYYVLGSQFIYQQFDRLAAGSTVRNLNIELASRVQIPVPPLEQQREIALQLGTISGETHALSSLYGQKLAALEALKESLLREAFTGAL